MRKFKHAVRGIGVYLAHGYTWFLVAMALGVVAFGYYFEISKFEWLALVLVIGMVMSAEAFNTAIEIHMNLTSPEQHPFARDTKDVAAGAVLISALIAIIVGLIVFLPKLILAV